MLAMSATLQAMKLDVQAATVSAQFFKFDYSVFKFDEKGLTLFGHPIAGTTKISDNKFFKEKIVENINKRLTKIGASIRIKARATNEKIGQIRKSIAEIPVKTGARVARAKQTIKAQVAAANDKVRNSFTQQITRLRERVDRLSNRLGGGKGMTKVPSSQGPAPTRSGGTEAARLKAQLKEGEAVLRKMRARDDVTEQHAKGIKRVLEALRGVFGGTSREAKTLERNLDDLNKKLL